MTILVFFSAIVLTLRFIPETLTLALLELYGEVIDMVDFGAQSRPVLKPKEDCFIVR